jgi:general secretion pathway protein H
MRAPTSPTPRSDPRAGFTLIEVSLALVVLALVAALALPAALPGRSATEIRIRAYAVAALLRADRTVAEAERRPVETAIDVVGRTVRSGVDGRWIGLPDDLALRWDGRNGFVRFTPDGRSSGGLLILGRGRAGYGVAINPATAAVRILMVQP